jgi:hypothetical protein
MEENYPFLVNDIIRHLEYVKTHDKNISMVDAIIEFCNKNNIHIETAGDAISSDNYLKSFIEKDCEMRKIFKSNTNTEEW